MLKLGSLFDGSGGFPLAARNVGIRPVWASEIEPFPIRVTKKNFPAMEHLGDISKLQGENIEPVDIITFGSPCFPAGTPILTAEGEVPIEGIVPGDEVLTHTGRYRTVTATGSSSSVTIGLSDGGHFIECTPNHPIWSSLGRGAKTWIRADKMSGMCWAVPKVYNDYTQRTPDFSTEQHHWFKVGRPVPLNEVKTVYNISVEQDESYVANGIVVHNCKNLSVCGDRTGLDGKDSSLFFEAVRVISEMHLATAGEYPRYLVFENVLGALSSHKGADFERILQEILGIGGIRYQSVRPEKWQNAGTVLADHMSLAWRTMDAQYWGVPQTRKRIFLVADFGGHRAGEILFRPGNLQSNPETCTDVWEDASSGDRIRLAPGYKGDLTLPAVVGNHLMDGNLTLRFDGIVPTLTAHMGTGGMNTPLLITERTDGNSDDLYIRKITPLECQRLQGFPDDWCEGLTSEDPDDETLSFFTSVWDTWCRLNNLPAKSPKQVQAWLKKKPTDAARYKMFGNGVVLPCVQYIMEGIVEASGC